jgi:hypothetical protein
VYALEARVREEVIVKLNVEKDSNIKMLRELATALKIPRLHLEWMKKNGVDEFVDRCKKIIEENDEDSEEFGHILDRMKARHGDSLKKFNNTSLNSEFIKTKKEFKFAAKPIPFVLQYPNEPLKARINSSQNSPQEAQVEKQKIDKSIDFSEMANSTQISIFEKEYAQATTIRGSVFNKTKQLPSLKLN